MPTYVYRRLGPDGRPDGTTFEVFQRISDDPLEVDPDTGQPVERVIGGGAGLIFKGTGFYETDYVRKSGTPESASASKSEGSKPESSKPESSAASSGAKNGSGSAASDE